MLCDLSSTKKDYLSSSNDITFVHCDFIHIYTLKGSNLVAGHNFKDWVDHLTISLALFIRNCIL
jgi:hypothetical protein